MTLPKLKTVPQIVSEEFWGKVDIQGADDCWLWTGYTNNGGYGRYAQVYAHRIAYHLTHNKQPDGIIRHTCDTPACCNPKHFLTGSWEDNIADRHARGRDNRPTGVKNPRCKLTEKQVLAIRSDTRRSSEVAQDYPVTPEMVYRIRRRIAWSHIGG